MNAAEQTASTLPAPPPKPFRDCPCGDPLTTDDWAAMPFVGLQDDGDGGWVELRNHRCGSTLAKPAEDRRTA